MQYTLYTMEELKSIMNNIDDIKTQIPENVYLNISSSLRNIFLHLDNEHDISNEHDIFHVNNAINRQYFAIDFYLDIYLILSWCMAVSRFKYLWTFLIVFIWINVAILCMIICNIIPRNIMSRNITLINVKKKIEILGLIIIDILLKTYNIDLSRQMLL